MGLVAACGDGARKESPPPSLSIGGLAPDGTLPACVWEPERAQGNFVLRNDAELPAKVRIAHSGGVPLTVDVFPRAEVPIPFVVPIEVKSIGIRIVWEGGQTVSGSLVLRPTVDERLIDLAPDVIDVVGGSVAHVWVRNRARVPARVELEAEPGMQLAQAIVDVPLLGIERVALDLSDPKHAWYAGDVVRVRGADCGNGPTKEASTSLSAFSAHIAEAVAAGDRHTCARSADGAVVCWGDNSEAQLARPVRSPSDSSRDPLVVAGLESGVSQIATGRAHTCALRDGKVLCWGASREGQCGIWTNGRAESPREVALPRRAVAVFAGANASCATLDDATLYCWGRILGASATTLPTPIGIVGVHEMAITYARWCAVDGGRVLRCWGKEPGDGSAATTTPVVVSDAIDHVVAGTGFTCGIHHGDDELPPIPPGSVVCWGETNGSTERWPRVVVTDADPRIVSSLSASGIRLCRAGDIVLCGSPFGPATEVFPHGVAAVANGGTHTCAIFGGGKLACVGTGDRGQTGTTTASGNVAGFDGP